MLDPSRLADAKTVLGSRRQLDLEWSLHAGALKEEIVYCEQRIGAALPPDVRAFLRRSNGADLYQHPRPRIAPNAGNNLFFLSTETIASETLDGRRFLRELGEPDVDSYVFLVDIQDGDYVVLDTGPGRNYLIEGNHEETMEWSTARPIARTFTEFVDTIIASMLSGGTARYWNEG
jgi:hypothetical protein